MYSGGGGGRGGGGHRGSSSGGGGGHRGSGSGGGGGGGGVSCGGGGRRNEGGSRSRRSGGAGGKNIANVECWNCHCLGHYQDQCQKPKRRDHANLAVVLDSGASSTMVRERHHLTDYRPTLSEITTATQGVSLKAVGRGTVAGLGGEALHVPNASHNLLSVSAVCAGGKVVLFDAFEAHVLPRNAVEADLSRSVASFICKDGLYKAELAPAALAATVVADAVPVVPPADASGEATLWHRRLGHPSKTTLSKLVREGLAVGVPDTLPGLGEAPCDVCDTTKVKRTPFPAGRTRASAPLGLLHTDVCSVSSRGRGGEAYFLVLVDDYSKHLWVVPLVRKSDATKEIKRLVLRAEREVGARVRYLRSDNGGEFVNAELLAWCEETGIQQQLTAAHSPQMNGVAERTNQTVLMRMRALLKDGQLPTKYWPDAALMAAYLINRTPSKVVSGGKTPLEAYTGVVPDLSSLRLFGCRVVACVLPVYRSDKKLSDNGVVGKYLGPLSNGAARFVMATGAVKTSADVRFDESIVTRIADLGAVLDLEIPAAATQEAVAQDGGVAAENEDEDWPADNGVPQEPVVVAPAVPVAGHDPPQVQPVVEEPDPEEAIEYVSAEEEASDDQPDEEEAPREPPTARTVTGVWAGKLRAAPSQTQRMGRDYGLLAATMAGKAPKTEAEAMEGPDADGWRRAQEKELRRIDDLDVWELTHAPRGARVLPHGWVLAVKPNGDLKARIVAKGCRQRAGRDYEESYAPVMRADAVRALLHYAATEDVEIRQLDIETAYLYGTLEEETYMVPPTSLGNTGGQVCRLRKALYGLCQAGLAWFNELSGTMRQLGFSASLKEPCLWRRDGSGGRLYVAIYVDDLLVVGGAKDVNKFVAEIAAAYSVRDLGDAKTFLGLLLTRDREQRTLTISQPELTQKVLRRAGMEDAAGARVPAVKQLTAEAMAAAGCGAPFDRGTYQGVVGMLNYLVLHTRPDLAFGVSQAARRSQSPCEGDWDAVQRMARYLRSVPGGIMLGAVGGDPRLLTAHVDASWETTGDCRAQTGLIVYSGAAPLGWRSVRQTSAATSSFFAETVAACTAADELVYFRSLLSFISWDQLAATELRCDNSSTIGFSNGTTAVTGGKARCLNPKWHRVSELRQEGTLRLVYISSSDNSADALTKPLGPKLLGPLAAMLRGAHGAAAVGACQTSHGP